MQGHQAGNFELLEVSSRYISQAKSELIYIGGLGPGRRLGFHVAQPKPPPLGPRSTHPVTSLLCSALPLPCSTTALGLPALVGIYSSAGARRKAPTFLPARQVPAQLQSALQCFCGSLHQQNVCSAGTGLLQGCNLHQDHSEKRVRCNFHPDALQA